MQTPESVPHVADIVAFAFHRPDIDIELRHYLARSAHFSCRLEVSWIGARRDF